MIKAIVISLFLGLNACQMTPKQDVTGMELDPKEKLAQQSELDLVTGSLDKLQFEKALDLVVRFQDQHRSSPYMLQAQMAQARALEGLGQWTEAIFVYRQIIESTRQIDEALLAQALYQVSYCYEALGDEAKVYSSLLDAEKLGSSLKPEILKAELPVRLAGSLNRMGYSAEAVKKIHQAELGLIQLKATKSSGTSTNWLARTYFQMGLLSTNQLSLQNFGPSIDTLKIVQIFSLRAVEESDPHWSELSAKTLVSTYRDLAAIVDQVPITKGQKIGREKKEQMAAQILETMEGLRTLRVTQDFESPLVVRLYSDLEPIQAKLVSLLHSSPIRNELTPEVQIFHNLKKKYRLQDVDKKRLDKK